MATLISKEFPISEVLAVRHVFSLGRQAVSRSVDDLSVHKSLKPLTLREIPPPAVYLALLLQVTNTGAVLLQPVPINAS